MRVCEDGVAASSVIHLPSATITYNVYKLVRLGAEVEEICQEGEEEIPAAQVSNPINVAIRQLTVSYFPAALDDAEQGVRRSLGEFSVRLRN